jgi:hypothetical protein
MAGQNVTTLQGTLVSGPPRSASGTFPAGLVSIAFTLRPANKSAAVSVKAVRNLQSPSSYATLHGIGSGEDVAQANFLFVQTDNPIDIRITSDDGAGGSVVAVVSVNGLLMIEKPADKFIKLLEAQGTGVVEYFASGNQ